MSFYSQIFTHLKVFRADAILWLSLDNPEFSNAISLDMISSLTTILREADRDPAVRVVVIRGAGSVFCSGGDVKAMKAKTGMFAGESNELRQRYIHGIQQIPKVMEDFSKPLIAMVNGAAIGAGCDLAMMCDLRVGCENSKFGESFVRLGLVPGDGGSYFLQRVVGYPKAMEMSLTGDPVTGLEAYRSGLLNIFASEQSLENETQALAHKIASQPPIAVQMTKKAIKLAHRSDLQTILELSAAYQGIAQRTQDHFAALEAMANKTQGNFSGT